MPSTTSNDLNTSTKWDRSNETHDGYKAWVNDVSLWANNNREELFAEIQRSAETDAGEDPAEDEQADDGTLATR